MNGECDRSQAGSPVLVAVLPWSRLPRAVRLLPIALFLVAAFLLRDSVGGQSSGVGVIALLPICWLALHGSRIELSIGLAGLAAFWVLPVLLIGGAEYPLSQLREAFMYVAVATMIGLSVRNLVRALAANAHNVARVASAARSVHTSPDTRSEICSAACEVSGATFAFLFEPNGTGGLDSTAMAGIDADAALYEAKRNGRNQVRSVTQPLAAADARPLTQDS